MGNIAYRSGARFLNHQQYHLNLANMCLLHGNRGEFSCDVFFPHELNCKLSTFTVQVRDFIAIIILLLVIFAHHLHDDFEYYDYNSFILSSLSNKGIIFSKLTKISHKFLEDLFPLFETANHLFQFSRKRAQGNEAGWVAKLVHGPRSFPRSGDFFSFKGYFWNLQWDNNDLRCAVKSLKVNGSPPFFMGWFARFTTFLIVRVYHPQGPIIFLKWWLTSR